MKLLEVRSILRGPVKARKSTAMLGVAWVATFVLYLFVKPETTVPIGTGILMNTLPKATVSVPQ